MTHEEATQVLVNAVSLAQQKGAFTLGDAKIIIEALQIVRPEIFVQKEQEEKEN